MNSIGNIIAKDPKITGGTAVFRGTRALIQAMFIISKAARRSTNSCGLPTVSREMALQALREASSFCSLANLQ
jgi:uncharacterized protein (DUF433 family)